MRSGGCRALRRAWVNVWYRETGAVTERLSGRLEMYRIFLSSPADVLSERNRAQTVIERLNAEHAGDGVFALTRWEESYYSATAPFQAQIVSPGEHDLVICIFWKRLGTELPPAYNRADGTTRTGTEYEFESARDARERREDHLPDILVYRKTAKVLFSEESFEVERAQKKALDQFWERWFRTDTGHYIAGFQSFADTEDFDRQLESNLREWLRRRHAGGVIWNIARQGSPYRGLVPFDEGHAGLFFGRDADMARARARFIESAIGPDSGRRGTPFLLILGASGSGKSSFLRAGLVPRMRTAGAPAFLEDGSDGIHTFRTLIVVPREMGSDLCAGLAGALYGAGASGGQREGGLAELADGDYPTPEAFAALASASPESAVAPILRALNRLSADKPGVDNASGPGRRFGLLLAIDQMEEIFIRPEADRRSFVRLLTALASTGRVWLVATMRNDFYDRLRLDPELSALADRGRIYDLAPPGLADYRDIIRRPALSAGLLFETNERRDLAAEIESEAGGEGALPMIAFLLEQLFQERRGNLLTFETYDRLGGAAGALAEHGDEVLFALPAAVQEAFPRVVRRLVRKSLQDLAPTASSAPLSVFPDGSPEHTLIMALADGRLGTMFTVVAPSDGAPVSAWVRWSHEALLTRWPRLRNSVDADRRDYETLDRVQRAHALWQGTPAAQRTARLLTDLGLAEAVDLVQRWGADVDESLRQFVEASQSHAQARRRRRRRTVTATVTTLSVFLIVAVIAGIMARKQRNLALMEQASADRTARFMVELFKIADPGENRGNSVTVREVLDRGAAEVSKGLEQDPAVRGELRTAMGQAYSGLGLYDAAKRLLTEARADQSGTAVPAESRVRTRVALGSTLYLAADYEEAAKVLQDAVSIARRELPPQSTLRSEALDDLADVLAQEEKYPEAERLCLEALAADRKRAEPAALARTLDSLGAIYSYSGNLPAAESTMREALALHEQASGLRDVMTAQAMANLAFVLYQSGRYEENFAILEKALPIYRDVYGPEHPEVATLLNNVGRSALMAGRIEDAVTSLRQAVALDEKLKGPTHDDLVAPLNSLAMIDAYQGHTVEATAEIRRAEQIARLPDHGVLLDQVLLNVADIELQQGNTDQAAAPLAESRRLLEAAYPLAKRPTEAWRYAVWDTVNAELLARRGDDTNAKRAIESAAPVIARRFGSAGFYSMLTQRRSHFVDEQRAHRTGKP
jgi:tetratricopeptide (TPR) repeat protein